MNIDVQPVQPCLAQQRHLDFNMMTDAATRILHKPQHRVRNAALDRLVNDFPQPVLGILVAGRNYVDGIQCDAGIRQHQLLDRFAAIAGRMQSVIAKASAGYPVRRNDRRDAIHFPRPDEMDQHLFTIGSDE